MSIQKLLFYILNIIRNTMLWILYTFCIILHFKISYKYNLIMYATCIFKCNMHFNNSEILLAIVDGNSIELNWTLIEHSIEH